MTKRTMSLLSAVAGICISAAVYFLQVKHFPYYAVESTRYVEFLLVVFSILCALLLLVTLIQKEDGSRPEWVKNPSKFSYTLILMLVYVFSLKYIGFYVGSVIFMFVLASLLGLKRPVLLIVCTILLICVVYGVFVRFLGVPVPLGIFEEFSFGDLPGSAAKAMHALRAL